VLLLFGVAAGTAEPARAQDPSDSAAATSGYSPTAVAGFLGGAAAALGAHESGHLVFDFLFDAHPGLQKVNFHGIPFFAITHDAGLSHRREFTIDSAGFWVQEAGNEFIFHKMPDLRDQHAPIVKGVLAFNVLASVAYAGAAFARTGPVERDTRGMAETLRWKEPYVGLLVLAPALLDAVRYYDRDPKWAAWASRGVKITSVVLVLR
jgi:hypothetical protein